MATVKNFFDFLGSFGGYNTAHKKMSAYTLTNDDVSRGPPGNISPLAVKFSGDGKLTYLFPDKANVRQIFSIDITNNTDSITLSESYQLLDLSDALSSTTISLQEQLRRERMRLFTTGVTTYEWIKSGEESQKKLVIPTNGQIFLFSKSSLGTPQSVYDGSTGDAVDPQVAPNGSSIAFVINDDLYVKSVFASSDSALVRLTTAGADDGMSCGLADYIAQEEMNRFVVCKLFPYSFIYLFMTSLCYIF